MATRYTRALINLLEKLGLTVPTNIRADQTLTPGLLDGVSVELDSIIEDLETVEQERTQYQSAAAQAIEQLATVQGQLATVQGELATVQGELATAEQELATAEAQLADAVVAGTADADATAADIRVGKTAYVNGVKIVGEATITE